ncbi:hypothetical protein CSUB01_09035 [Colletotrichum sublineola]|uniref:Uncharacterized protein n=1 Tax=Colletotrichum sublineola TaxID=1173701 RepID=A0A066WW52_COLSU|nr:hypothetical protein CSUB01_09035 [Colletotrichum sublineola]
MSEPPAKKQRHTVVKLHEPKFDILDYCVRCVWKMTSFDLAPGVSGEFKLIVCEPASAEETKIVPTSAYEDCLGVVKAYLTWWHHVCEDGDEGVKVEKAKQLLKTRQKAFRDRWSYRQLDNEAASRKGVAEARESGGSSSDHQETERLLRQIHDGQEKFHKQCEKWFAKICELFENNNTALWSIEGNDAAADAVALIIDNSYQEDSRGNEEDVAEICKSQTLAKSMTIGCSPDLGQSIDEQ